MKAIRVQHTGGPEVMELVELARPQPKPTEAVVKISAAGVNSIDGHFRDGSLRTPLPFIPGQEGAGVVTAVGARAKAVKVGDRVAWSGTLGSYAEYVAAAADSLVPVPDEVTDQQVAAAMMHGLTAHYLVNDAHKLKAGETALVHAAAGGVGLLLVQMAHMIGARVIGTTSSQEKAKLAREAGADEVIVFTQQDFEADHVGAKTYADLADAHREIFGWGYRAGVGVYGQPPGKIAVGAGGGNIAKIIGRNGEPRFAFVTFERNRANLFQPHHDFAFESHVAGSVPPAGWLPSQLPGRRIPAVKISLKPGESIDAEVSKIMSNVWWDNITSGMEHAKQALLQLAGGPEMTEGASAFMAKRKPDFRQFRV